MSCESSDPSGMTPAKFMELAQVFFRLRTVFTEDETWVLQQLVTMAQVRPGGFVPEKVARRMHEMVFKPFPPSPAQRTRMEGDGKAEFLDVWLRELGEGREWLGCAGGPAFGQEHATSVHDATSTRIAELEAERDAPSSGAVSAGTLNDHDQSRQARQDARCAMKFLGADICAFYREWPPGHCWYHDYSELEIEDYQGQPLLDPATKYDGKDLGLICWQGPSYGHPDPGPVKIGSVTLVGEPGIEHDFDRVLAAWLRARSVVTVGVEIPREQFEHFTALAAANGWKVRK